VTRRSWRGRAGCVARRACAGAVALVVLCAVALPAQADDPPKASIETAHRDPWVPPEIVPRTPPVPTRGKALRAQAEQTLQFAFDAADTSHSGALTREEARAAGLGFIVRHFDDIDVARRGIVTFADVERYLDTPRTPAAGPPR
jgi:hypothetical protein